LTLGVCSWFIQVEKAPLESYADVGGLESQIQEIKEAVELPLTHPELYEDIGIKPPKGVCLYGEPGTGKTLLAKAVANSTSATFLRVVGSELIQKYLGDGPKLVRNCSHATGHTQLVTRNCSHVYRSRATVHTYTNHTRLFTRNCTHATGHTQLCTRIQITR
jgi:ATP-dependent Zn protease